MKRSILATLAIILGVALCWAAPPVDKLPSLLPTPAEARITSVIVGGSPPASGGTYADILFWLNFEANDTTGDYNMGSSECAATSGDTSGAYTSGATISSSTYKVGSYALSIPTTYDELEFAAANIINTTEGRIGFWFYTPTGNRSAGCFVRLDVDADNLLHIYSLGTNFENIGMKYRSGGVNGPWIDVESNPISLDTWHFLEFYWKTGASGILVDGVSVGTSSSSFTPFNASTGTLQFSNDGVDYECPFFIDNFIISNDSDRDLCGLNAGSCQGLAITTSKPSGSCP